MSRRDQRTRAKVPSLPDPSGQNSVLGLFRAFAGPAFIIGGWQMIQVSCLWGVIVVYFGFAISLMECIWEPELVRRSYQIQVCLIAIIVLFVTVFTINVAFVRAPIEFLSLVFDTDYSSGVGPAGIAWHPFYTELDVMVINPSDGNYDNVDLWIRPDSMGAAIGQLSGLTDVSFEDKFGLREEINVDDMSHHVSLGNMSFIATNAGYKVHCGHIPPHYSLRLVMAVIDFRKYNPVYVTPEDLTSEQTFTDADGVFTYWFGTPSNPSLYESRAKPKKVTVAGSYTVNYCKHQLKREIIVFGGSKSNDH